MSHSSKWGMGTGKHGGMRDTAAHRHRSLSSTLGRDFCISNSQTQYKRCVRGWANGKKQICRKEEGTARGQCEAQGSWGGEPDPILGVCVSFIQISSSPLSFAGQMHRNSWRLACLCLVSLLPSLRMTPHASCVFHLVLACASLKEAMLKSVATLLGFRND